MTIPEHIYTLLLAVTGFDAATLISYDIFPAFFMSLGALVIVFVSLIHMYWGWRIKEIRA